MHVDRRLYCVALAVLSAFVAAGYRRAQAQDAPAGAAVVNQVEVGGENGATTVRVRGVGALTVRVERLTAPDRLVLDFANARIGTVHPAAAASVGPVRGIRVGQFRPNVARVVVDLNVAATYHIENGDGSVTVVFDSDRASAPQAPPALKQVRAEELPKAVAAAIPNATPAVRANPAPPAPKAAIPPFFDANAPGHAAPVPRSAAVSTGATGMAMVAVNNPPNSFQNGLLTFTAKNRPLDLVLDDIGGITNVPIVMAEDVGTEQVSAEFRGFRLDEALRQILKNYDVLLSYSGSDSSEGNPTPRTVWVYPPNQGPGMGRFAMKAWNASARQYQQTLTAADPDERARATDELIRRDGRGAVSVVMGALKDPSDKVRYQALYRAMLVGALPPEDTMIDLALNDSSEQVRVWSFQTLPLDPTLRWVALRASNDSNQQMAELARNYLRDLDGSLGSSSPDGASEPAPQVLSPATAQPFVRHPVAQPQP